MLKKSLPSEYEWSKYPSNETFSLKLSAKDSEIQL